MPGSSSMISVPVISEGRSSGVETGPECVLDRRAGFGEIAEAALGQIVILTHQPVCQDQALLLTSVDIPDLRHGQP